MTTQLWHEMPLGRPHQAAEERGLKFQLRSEEQGGGCVGCRKCVLRSDGVSFAHWLLKSIERNSLA